MEEQIDFSTYSLAELYSAAETVDRNQYPERVKEIEQLIKQKIAEPLNETNDAQHLVESPKESDNTKRVGGKATRGDRFLAALIDGLIAIIASIPIFIYVDFDLLSAPSFSLTASLMAYGLIAGFILNGYLIFHYGQTIGKNFMSIRIENLDDTKASLSTIYLKRIIPMQLLSMIPMGGQFVSGIVNVLFIFGKEKRCLHDYIAKTKVCYTNN